MNRRAFLTILLSLSLLAFAGCGANEGVLRSGKEPPLPADPGQAVQSVEAEIEGMRTAGFTYIYVLRRKDGRPIDGDDRTVIKAQTANANRRVATDEARAVIIGSNYVIPKENMTVLLDRFAVENFSPTQ